MARILMARATAQMTGYAKRLVAGSMYKKGQSFLAAAMLLRKRGGYEYVVLHLLCQGIENLAKAYLLSVNYDTYKPKLKNHYGHNLLKLAAEVEKTTNIRILKLEAHNELVGLNNLYKENFLRYGSGYDLLLDSSKIPSRRVTFRVAALSKLAAQRGVFP